MGILSRHRNKPPRFDPANSVLFDAALARGGVSVGAIPPKHTVRTRCPYCDEWCYRLRLTDGGELLLEISGSKYIHHQCPVPIEDAHAGDQDDPEPL